MTQSYFETLDEVLVQAGQASPCLVLDLDRFEANIALARRRVQAGVGLRVVAKSLACLPMLDRAVSGLEAVGVMTFSLERLRVMLKARPEWTHLLGKPLPVRGAAEVLAECPNAAEQVTWLVDTVARAEQYAELAKARGVSLRVALELDAGLHRGGVAMDQAARVAHAVRAMQGLSLVGVMGYEPHLAKLPGLVKGSARRQVLSALQQGAALVSEGLVNTGGSMSFAAYGRAEGVSEVSLGSVLVKPTDFDLPSTEGFEPALFIAAPILKYMPDNPVPGFDAVQALTRLRRKADLAIYGGYWKGKPVHPAGYGYSGVFGHSSNQEVWSGPYLKRSPVDRFAFLRPTQSEAVLPEFGQVVVVSGGEIVDRWETMGVAQ
ncbi:MAG: alanine racemase [Paracoccaceae bacterium]